MLGKVFEILQCKIEIPNNLKDNKAFNDVYKQTEKNLNEVYFINCCFNNLWFINFQIF